MYNCLGISKRIKDKISYYVQDCMNRIKLSLHRVIRYFVITYI